MLRLAHRGDVRRAPENTLAALAAALGVPGCDGLEFDVRAARDGTPVLLHDVTLARVQGRPGRVEELLPSELAPLGVPTLAGALAAVGSTSFLDVELKGDPGPRVVDVLEAARGPKLVNAVVSSFDERALARIRTARPRWSCWLNADDLSDETVAAATGLGCRGVSIDRRAIDRAAMERATAAELTVAAWTVRDVAELERLSALGVVAVCVGGEGLDGRVGSG